MQVLNLILNCIRVNKPLFCTSGACMTMVVLCATNLDGVACE